MDDKLMHLVKEIKISLLLQQCHQHFAKSYDSYLLNTYLFAVL